MGRPFKKCSSQESEVDRIIKCCCLHWWVKESNLATETPWKSKKLVSMDRFPKFANWNWGSSNIQPHHPRLCSSLALNGTQGGLEVTTQAGKNMADVGNKTRSLEAFGMCLGGRNDPHWIFHSWASSRSWSNEECILILIVECSCILILPPKKANDGTYPARKSI